MLNFAPKNANENMKKTAFKAIMLASLAAVVVACGGQRQSDHTDTIESDTTEEVNVDGVQRLGAYDYTDTVAIGGRTYVYSIHRESSDSLPTVVDDEGVTFTDNIYTLKVDTEGRTLFSRCFTKSDFAHLLSDEFLRKGILDGMAFEEEAPVLRFAVCVSLPQSDMLEPLLLQIDAQGGYTVERDSRSDMGEALEKDSDE